MPGYCEIPYSALFVIPNLHQDCPTTHAIFVFDVLTQAKIVISFCAWCPIIIEIPYSALLVVPNSHQDRPTTHAIFVFDVLTQAKIVISFCAGCPIIIELHTLLLPGARSSLNYLLCSVGGLELARRLSSDPRNFCF